MDFLKKLLKGGEDAPPPVPNWLKLPSLSVAVFGSIRATPDLELVKDAYRTLAQKAFPTTEANWTANRSGIEKFYQEEADRRLQVAEIPPFSKLGLEDRRSRLFSVSLNGMIWLLLEEGAAISRHDALLVPATLSEFVSDPKCMLVQGSGYHLFVRHTMFRWNDSKMSDFVTKRVSYLTIDPRKKNRFEI